MGDPGSCQLLLSARNGKLLTDLQLSIARNAVDSSRKNLHKSPVCVTMVCQNWRELMHRL